MQQAPGPLNLVTTLKTLLCLSLLETSENSAGKAGVREKHKNEIPTLSSMGSEALVLKINTVIFHFSKSVV